MWENVRTISLKDIERPQLDSWIIPSDIWTTNHLRFLGCTSK
jgi:hypothetical protein